MEVEELIDAGFLSLAKKLYIDNEKAVDYILSMFERSVFLIIGFSGSSYQINLTSYEM